MAGKLMSWQGWQKFGKAQGRKSRRARRNNVPRHVDLGIERLENRWLLAAGDLDTTFDFDGVVSGSLTAGDDVQINSMAVQSDGKIVVAGSFDSPTNPVEDVLVARFNADGTLDTSFADNDSVGGWTNFLFNGGQSFAFDIAIDNATGDIYVAGHGVNSAGTQVGFAVARLSADGELDNSFGTAGIVVTTFAAGSSAQSRGVVLQSDGKIVVAGFEIKTTGTRQDFALARYNTDGSLDTTFDGDGKLTTHFDGNDDRAFDVVIQQVGAYEKILVVGKATRSTLTADDFALARYNPDGSLDTAGDAFDAVEFGVGGKVTTAVGASASSSANAVAIDLAGRIVVAGTRDNFSFTSTDVAVTRYTANGSLDTSFNPTGVGYNGAGPIDPGTVRINYDQLDTGSAVLIQPDGKYVIGGFARPPFGQTPGNHRFALARINVDGSLDTSFGTGGLVQAPTFVDSIETVAGQPDLVQLWDLAMEPSGKLVAAGWVDFEPSPIDGDFLLARYESGLVLNSIAGLSDVDEGGTYTLQLTSSNPSTSQWTINWGDGDTQIVPGNPSNVTHVYDDGDANHTISATVTTNSGTSAVGNTVSVMVHNVAPTLAISGAADVNEGAVYTLNLSPFDPGDDTITSWTINWGDGTEIVAGDPTSITHTYSDGDANFTISATATDEDGTFAAGNTVAVMVHNGAPALALSGAADVNEGAIYTLNLSSLDPGDDTITSWTINWGDGTEIVTGDPTSVTHTYLDGDANHTISATATDEDGTFAAGNTVAVMVHNVAPALAISGAADVNEGALYTLNLSSLDPDDDTISQWTINWGDGIEIVAGNPTSVTHTYLDGDANFTISATATDEDGTFAAGNTVAVMVHNLPPAANDATFSLTENSPNGTVVGSLTADDPGDDTLSFSIVGGTPAGAFAINASSGQITVADESLLDFETWPTLTLEVEVSDGDGGSDVALVTINLLNLASIRGEVFVDVNQNGLFEADEPGIDGVVINLLDQSGNPVLDALGDAITAVTNGGVYLFEDLDPGIYQLFETQPAGVNDGAESLGSLGGTIIANDRMQLTLAQTDAFDYAFAEIGQQLTSGDAARIAFWQNKRGQELITQGGTQLAAWLTTNFANIFGNSLDGASGSDVANFYRDQLFKQKTKKSAGPARVDAQFMAVALATYFTSQTLAGQAAIAFGFNVTDTGIGTKIVNVGTNGAAFGVADGTDLTILELLQATDSLTDQPDSHLGFASIYDTDGDGVISAPEATLRTMANDIFSAINKAGDI